MSFYLYLPSDVSPRYFPNNRVSDVRVKLPERIVSKPDQYKVGLVEMSYIKSVKFKLPKHSRVFGPQEDNEQYSDLPRHDFSSEVSLTFSIPND